MESRKINPRNIPWYYKNPTTWQKVRYVFCLILLAAFFTILIWIIIQTSKYSILCENMGGSYHQTGGKHSNYNHPSGCYLTEFQYQSKQEEIDMLTTKYKSHFPSLKFYIQTF